MSPGLQIRKAVVDDAAVVGAIYRPYVEETAVSFEEEVPAVEELARRIHVAQSRWCWLLAFVDGEPAGYAYAGAHRARAAYRYSVETSAYVSAAFQRKGVARALYRQLLGDLDVSGFCNAYAGITLPNEASVGFHERMGFRSIGVFPGVGRKFGRWHDVAWLHRPIGERQARAARG